MVIRKRLDGDRHGSKDGVKHIKDGGDVKNNNGVREGWSCKKISINILKTLLLIIVVPAFLNFSALIREEKELHPEGVLIDIKHGQKLLRICNGTGSPTVILDAPSGETSDVWSLIFSELSKYTKVCMYDRAGLGYSDRIRRGVNETKHVGKPHTVERMVEDFHKLFENEEKPFTLVGADLGAVVAKFYAQMYQDSIASVVFINPIFEGIFLGGNNNPWSKYWYNYLMPSLQIQHIFSALGVTRIGLQTGMLQEPLGYPETPDIVKKRQKYLRCKPGHVSTIVEESYFLNETLSQSRTLQKLRPFPNDIPTTIILTDQYKDKMTPDRNKVWLRAQEMFLKSFTPSNLVTTKLKGFLPKALFSNHKYVGKIIKNSVFEWRKKSKVASKY